MVAWDGFAGVLELPDRERADVLGCVAVTFCDLTRDLRLIHRGGYRESAELDKKISERQGESENRQGCCTPIYGKSRSGY